MPKRTDIRSILIIGAGPIIIGQACEFDYSGAQACKALREEGYKVILVNSNPATIMTDPEMADVTYIEPVQWQMVESIIAKERPDALLPTMGGQTGLNCALDLAKHGVLEKYGVEMIGASREAIDKAEDREKFKQAMKSIGLDCPRSMLAHSMEEALQVQAAIGYPVVIRPSFTLGGSGGGIAYNREEFIAICERGLDASPTKELLIEESVIGWKEFEMEVVRDKADNCIIICSIENLDPMGVHTGDSITVAPAQTLTDKEYQIMRNASIAVLREIGVETGGSNVQFAINPADGKMVVIEMNPRVSRSSRARLQGDRLPDRQGRGQARRGLHPGRTQERNHRRRDAGVVRAEHRLRRHQDSALRLREISAGEQPPHHADEIGGRGDGDRPHLPGVLPEGAARPGDRRRRSGREDHRPGGARDRARRPRSGAHLVRGRRVPLRPVVRADPARYAHRSLVPRSNRGLGEAGNGIEGKAPGRAWTRARCAPSSATAFPTGALPRCSAASERQVRERRRALGVRPVYKRVDTCAAEFATNTAYMYSTYEEECEADPTGRKKIMVLGGGPNRIGQGIEFDYCCVHAALALREDGYETIMVNCNPETVSTDYDTSDRLYFEPLTLEDVLEIVDKEKPYGVVVQYGGQTPLKLARDLEANGVPIIGTSPDMIDVAEDRERFQKLLHDLGLKQPPNRTARNEADALRLAQEIGYPLVVRPSYVLGGRAMEIVHEQRDLERYMREAVKVSNDSPVLLDRFLNDAIEVDVDAICDGERVLIGGIMEHIEQAGVHSGDSACSLPPYSLSAELQQELRLQTVQMAMALNVVGLMNVQFAIQSGTVFVLEVNPRASRTVPFVSKATGLPLAKIAARCMVGTSLDAQGVMNEVVPPYYSVKEAVFPFIKFPGVDTILGPEMKSTGEVMGVGESFGEAFVKSQLAAGVKLPKTGKAFISVRNSDKNAAVQIGRELRELGFSLIATRGTAQALNDNGIKAAMVNKVGEGRPHILDMIKNGEVSLIVNTVDEKRSAVQDSWSIRNGALQGRVTYYTTIAGARAACTGMRHIQDLVPYALQSLHQRLN